MRFPVSLRWTSYVVYASKGSLKNAVSEIWTNSCGNFETVRKRISVSINH